MKPCLKVKSNKCFGQIHTNDEVKLAKMCRLFMKVSLDLELGPRLENAALRFNHIQRRLSSDNTPRAAGRFGRVAKAAAERLDTFRKSDLIQFSKCRHPTKKEDSHEDSQKDSKEDSKLPWATDDFQAPEASCSLIEIQKMTEEPVSLQPFTEKTCHIHDSAGWEVQEVAPLTEAAIPFLGTWDQLYQDSTCWDWQGYSTNYMDNFQQCYQEMSGQFQEFMDLIPPTPAFPSEFIPHDTFFALNEQPVSHPPALEIQSATDESLYPQPPLPAVSPEAKPQETEATEPVCHNCGVTSTPLWRFPSGRGRLCNACGLYFKMHQRQRPIELKKNSDAKKPPYRPRALECMDCNSHSTSLWRRDSNTGRPLCNSCGLYRRIKHQKRPEHLYSSKIKKRHRNTNSSPDNSSLCNTPLNQEFKDLCLVEYFNSDQN